MAAPKLNLKPNLDNALIQGRLRHWRPVFTPGLLIPSIYVIGFLLLGLSIFYLVEQPAIYETTYSALASCEPSYPTAPTADACTFTINVEKDVPGPAFVYYKITNFYQTHRQYANSLSPNQLLGKKVATATLETECAPQSPLGSPFCGLVYASRFNDTFSSFSAAGGPNLASTWRGDGIAWPSDRKHRYAKDTVMTDDDMVWMRVAASPDFYKLYRVVDEGIPAGTYTVTGTGNWPAKSFDGTKSFAITHTSPFGGPNKRLVVIFMLVSVVYLVTALILTVLYYTVPRSSKYDRMRALLARTVAANQVE